MAGRTSGHILRPRQRSFNAPLNAPVLVAVVLGGILISACGGATVSAPSPSTASVAGTWTGTYSVVSCFGGIEACFGLSQSYPISLVLQQSGNAVTGSMSGTVPPGGKAGQVRQMPVTGNVDARGVLAIQGSQPFVYGTIDPSTTQTGITLTSWVTSMDTGGESMLGAFQLAVVFRTTNAYPDSWQIGAVLISLSRQP